VSRRPASAAQPTATAEAYTRATSAGTPPAQQTPFELFRSLSVTLTGFSDAELSGTAMAQTYFTLIPSIVGEEKFGRLLAIWRDTYIRGQGDEPLLEKLVKEQIFEEPDLGPIARNVVTLWYLGMWFQMPASWRNKHGAWANDVTFVVSPQSYTEGLVWKAIHTHPPAAKQPGYGSWALPPVTTGDPR
jgi:hypothetical protein